MARTQKALVIAAIGSPMIETTRPIPTPTDHEILVRVSIAGLNPHDEKSQTRGLFIANSLPSPLALDILGIIESLGPSVKDNLTKDDKVFGYYSPMNPDSLGTQEFALLDSRYLAKVPVGLSNDDAITMSLNPFTAFWALFSKIGLQIPPPAPFSGSDANYDYSRHSIVIIGGGTACGKYGIAWCKHVGISTVVATASLSSANELKALGATHIVDRKLPDAEVISQVRYIVDDDLLYVYDTINHGHDVALGVHLLSNFKKGTVVSISGGAVNASAAEFAEKKAGFQVKNITALPWLEPALAASYWDKLPTLIEEGVLKPTRYSIIDGLNVDAVNQVLRDYSAGKVVVKPNIHVS